jgi:8-oxo-dGTP pyrophosphatase MutT (NUDIX family)
MATVIDQSWYQRSPDAQARTSAGGVIARIEKASIVIALAREGDHENLVLPKGGVEPDESLVEAARREIEEEIGISELVCLGPLGVCERLSFNRKNWITTHYFLFLTAQVNATPTHSDRHWHGPRWIGVGDDRGLAEIFWPEQRELIQMNRRHIETSVRAAHAKEAGR